VKLIAAERRKPSPNVIRRFTGTVPEHFSGAAVNPIPGKLGIGRAPVDLLNARLAGAFRLVIHGYPPSDDSLVSTPPNSINSSMVSHPLIMVVPSRIAMIAKLSRRPGRVCTPAHKSQGGARELLFRVPVARPVANFRVI
jgi:hypothetical protein